MAGAVVGLAGVTAVVPDQQLRTASLGFDPASQNGSMTNVTRLTGAQSLWKSGSPGAGVDVALVDSGVAPVPALADPAKVVVGPDLSFESQDPDLRYLDTYGHGTHMGGIIAGRERGKASGAGYASDTANFYGMAPDARLVEVKVADHDGAVDVSQVIAAIDWVVQNKSSNGLNIRVLNLSFGTMSPQAAQTDPLSWAAEVAWKAGVVVVASAGNDGATTPGIANPAYNPFVLAVGAADTKGTDTTADDVVPDFSARQGGNWGSRGIDLVAPGVGIVAPARRRLRHRHGLPRRRGRHRLPAGQRHVAGGRRRQRRGRAPAAAAAEPHPRRRQAGAARHRDRAARSAWHRAGGRRDQPHPGLELQALELGADLALGQRPGQPRIRPERLQPQHGRRHPLRGAGHLRRPVAVRCHGEGRRRPRPPGRRTASSTAPSGTPAPSRTTP